MQLRKLWFIDRLHTARIHLNTHTILFEKSNTSTILSFFFFVCKNQKTLQNGLSLDASKDLFISLSLCSIDEQRTRNSNSNHSTKYNTRTKTVANAFRVHWNWKQRKQLVFLLYHFVCLLLPFTWLHVYLLALAQHSFRCCWNAHQEPLNLVLYRCHNETRRNSSAKIWMCTFITGIRRNCNL